MISNRLHEGYEPNFVDCEYTAGLLSRIPALFGLEPAVVGHEDCQVRAPACVSTCNGEHGAGGPGVGTRNGSPISKRSAASSPSATRPSNQPWST